MTQVRFQRRQCANCGIHNTANPFEILCPKGKGVRSPHDWCIIPGWEGMREIEQTPITQLDSLEGIIPEWCPCQSNITTACDHKCLECLRDAKGVS